jgi:ribosomal protein L22
MVIRQVHNQTNPFSREPRAARIARTERQLLSKSPNMATSTKKLVHLARQIKGKTVSEALVQMRFSKKKYAQEVRLHLEESRDLAVVERGMGLGKKAAGSSGDNGGSSEAVEIQTKDGKWIKVDDPTRMYVAEAWVNRGSLRGKLPEYRARGRMNILQLRAASKSCVNQPRYSPVAL